MIIELNSTWKELLALGYNQHHIDKAIALVKGAPFVVTIEHLQWIMNTFKKDDINTSKYVSRSARQVYNEAVKVSHIPRRKTYK